jgi:hypothetical protein
MSEIIAWLESPEGERWSKLRHDTPGYRGKLIGVKEDTDEGPCYAAVLLYV